MMTLKEYLASDRMDYFSPFSKGYLLDYLLPNGTILDSEICTHASERGILYEL